MYQVSLVMLACLVASSWGSPWMTLQKASYNSILVEHKAPSKWPESYGPFKKVAPPCDPKACKLPDCRCSGWDIPGNLSVEQVPQMVLFAFHAAVHDQNFQLYQQLFENRVNPNNCPKSGTFFVSHNYTYYCQVQTLYAGRHEIGVNTVTSPPPPLTPEHWKSQISIEKEILVKWANISAKDIHGFRAPYLAPGGDDMITAIEDSKLQYDSSRTTVKFMDDPHILWPYTYDYASTQDCVQPTCPEDSHKGIWEIPLVAWKCRDGSTVAVPLTCNVLNKQQAFDLLKNKFLDHYQSKNRAPLVIPLDTAWLTTSFKYQATLMFLDFLDTLKSKDAYVVTHWQALQWIRKPTPLSKIKSFSPWKCDKPAPYTCEEKESITCKFDSDRKIIKPPNPGTPVYILRTCVQTCPKCYPYLDDPYGLFC